METACYVCGHSAEEHTNNMGRISECQADNCDCIHYEPEPEDDEESPDAK